MSYEDAEATKMLATECLMCNRPLLDAVSVETGMGPICRKKYGWDSGPTENRIEANKLVHLCATQPGTIRESCRQLRELGFYRLAGRIEHRGQQFIEAVNHTLDGIEGWLIHAPYNAKATESWRRISGRAWITDKKANFIPLRSRQGFYDLLRKHYPGRIVETPLWTKQIPEYDPSPDEPDF